MLIKSEVPFPFLGMNWTMAELLPKFSLETMYWKLSLYSLCPVHLSILNFSASPICCWNSWMCHKGRCLKFLYISVGNQPNLISNDPWEVRQCSVCLCALGGSRDSQQEKWLPTQPVYILFPCIIQGLRSNDVFLWWISTTKCVAVLKSSLFVANQHWRCCCHCPSPQKPSSNITSGHEQ